MKLRIVPTNEYEIHTGLPRSAVYQRLDDVVAEGGFGPRTRGKYFKGEVTKEDFCIMPLLESSGFHYNSFLPIVKGSYREEGDEVVLSIQTSLSHGINAFFLFFLCVCVLIMVSGTYLFFTTGTCGELIFLGVLFLLFLFVMTYLGFYMEDRKTRNTLLRLFEDTGDVLTNRPVCWHYGVNGEIQVKKRICEVMFYGVFAIQFLFFTFIYACAVCFGFEDLTVEYICCSIIIVLVCAAFFYLVYQVIVSKLILADTHINLRVKKDVYYIPYEDIKEAILVWRRATLGATYKEKGTLPKHFEPYIFRKNYQRQFYDIINKKDELICSVSVGFLFQREDFEDKMLYKGIPVKGEKGYYQLKHDTLKGNQIDYLKTNPVQLVLATTIQKYIDFYNKRVLEKNRWFGNFTKDKHPVMEMTDTYEAGFVYWTTKVQDAIVYCKDGEMVREDIAQYIEVDWPKNNSIVYYIKNVDKDVIIIIKND